MWKNDIFELLFFGKSDWAMSQTKNKEVILFNCQYSGWKYLKSNQKIASEDVGVIPIHYEGGLE